MHHKNKAVFEVWTLVAGQRPPTVKQAHDQLTAALKEHQDCENRGKEGKKLLARMLESRKETSQIAQTYDIT